MSWSTFCHGSLATTNSTRSRSSARRVASATATWAPCTGSKVPPKTPIRSPRSAGGTSASGQLCHHRSEGLHLRLVHDDVVEPEPLAAALDDLGDLLDIAHEADRGALQLLGRDRQGRRQTI